VNSKEAAAKPFSALLNQVARSSDSTMPPLSKFSEWERKQKNP
jgi:hypothetical protein